MQKLLFSAFFSLLVSSLFAQTAPRGNAKVSGTVVDSITGSAMEFASIALIDQATDKPIDGGMTDEKGRFELEKLPEGTFAIRVNFIGYPTIKTAPFTLSKGQNKKLGNITIAPSATMLKEVTVTSRQELFEEQVDRMVYNAEKDVASRGGDATDVLRKVPMLTVDLDGNVSLRGSQNVRVLINNKPSSIMASSVADALKQIPADMIKSVEVITSPSARYDAEGTGGIINIVTKKTTLEGLTLNIDGGVGNRSSNLGLNGNYRRGKMGFSLGGWGRAFYNPAETDTRQETFSPGLTTLVDQSIDAYDLGAFGRYSLGWDYDIAEGHNMSANARFGGRGMNKDQEQTSLYYENGILTDQIDRMVDNTDANRNMDFNLDYLRTFKPRQEWSISTQYSRNDLVNDFDAEIIGMDGIIDNRTRNDNDNLNQEFTLQTDFQTPIGDMQLFETGAKGILRKVDSDYAYFYGEGPDGALEPDPRLPSGALDYAQQVGATYASYTFSTPSKYNFKVGARYEFTGIQAETTGVGAIDLPDYHNLVPSINISKTYAKGVTVRAGYNRRIQRPGLGQLNPNVNAANAQNISVGNPLLRPELSDNFELGISSNIGKTYINLTTFTRYTNNAITQVRIASDTLEGSIITTWENAGTQTNYGANLFGNFAVTPKITLNGGVDAIYSRIEGQTLNAEGIRVNTENSGFILSGRVWGQWQISDNWNAQAFGMIRNPQVQLQGTQSGFYMYSLGLKRDFKNKKGSLGLSAENFLTKGTVLTNTLESAQFVQTSETQLYNRGIKLTFNYRIGKMGFDQQPRKKTKSVRNDDVKDGEGGGDNGGGGQTPAPATGGGKPATPPAGGGKKN
ncbi:MAG: TonB-dependent receptor [Saprospiraceae bacterium]|nr:TonB-dependent receptor [Saprospiraceae bacterium]